MNGGGEASSSLDRVADRRGVALAMAVVALFVFGALLGSAFLVCLGDERVGRKVVRLSQVSAAAEAGALDPLVHWDPRTYNRLEVRDSAPFAGRLEDGTGTYRGSVTRLGPQLFLVVAEGVGTDGEVRGRAGTLMRLHPLQLVADAALKTRGPLDIGESARLSGLDRAPYGWICPPVGAPLPALRSAPADSGSPLWTGCAATRCLEGDPPYEADSLEPAAALLTFGGVTLADLRAVAAPVLAGGTIWVQPSMENGTCVTAAPANWGDPYDPAGPCGDYFPTVFSTADLSVTGGRGQGVLVVEGDLMVTGGFDFRGVVVVLGSFRSVGSGCRIDGALISANRALEPQTVDGATTIQYSSCAVEKALAGSGRGVLLGGRAWLDVY